MMRRAAQRHYSEGHGIQEIYAMLRFLAVRCQESRRVLKFWTRFRYAGDRQIHISRGQNRKATSMEKLEASFGVMHSGTLAYLRFAQRTCI